LLSIVLRGIQRFFAISFAKHEGEELVLIANKKTAHQLELREPLAATELAALACPPASPVG